MSREYWVYIMTNVTNNVLYIGVTNNIERRAFEHSQGESESFTRKYHVNKLVYCESTNDVMSAIEREKQLKKWSRIKKIKLVESMNPTWKELRS